MGTDRITRIVTFWLLIATGLAPVQAESRRESSYGETSGENALAWQRDVRTKLNKILNMDVFLKNGRKPALAAKLVRESEHETYTAQEWEVDAVEGKRIRILVTLPSVGAEPFPAVVGIAGHDSSAYSIYDTETWNHEPMVHDDLYHGFGTILAKRGFITVTTQVAEHQMWKSHATRTGERLWVLMRCIDLLGTLPRVDRHRIGTAGLSLGGTLALWLGAMDQRVDAVLSAGALTTMGHMTPDKHCQCWVVPGLAEAVDWPDVAALIAPRPLNCQIGQQEPEQGFPVELAEQAMAQLRPIYEDLGAPDHVTLDIHEGAHEINVPGLLEFADSLRKVDGNGASVF